MLYMYGKQGLSIESPSKEVCCISVGTI